MSDLNWKPTPNTALGYTEVAKVTDKVSLVIAHAGDPDLKWGLYRVIQGEAPQPIRSFYSMNGAKEWAKTAECKSKCLDAVQVTAKPKDALKISELRWYPDPSSIVGGKSWTAKVSDDVRLFVRPSGMSDDRWWLFKTTPDEPLSFLKTFPSRESAELWAESADGKRQCSLRPSMLQSKSAPAKQVAPEQRIVAGYNVYFRDGTTIFCIGSLKAIKAQLGTEWSSILPVLVYQHGDIEDLGQIIDQKA